MKLQREKSKIKSRINYGYYAEVLLNVFMYSFILYISIKLWIWFIKLIIKMMTTI